MQLNLPGLDKVASVLALDLYADADVSQQGIRISLLLEDHLPQVSSGARTHTEGVTQAQAT